MKEFIKITIEGTKFIDKNEYKNMGRYWLMINTWNIQEQLYADLVSDGINYEIAEIVKKELKRKLRLLEIWGNNAKNGKKSRSIQKNCCQNKKDKC